MAATIILGADKQAGILVLGEVSVKSCELLVIVFLGEDCIVQLQVQFADEIRAVAVSHEMAC